MLADGAPDRTPGESPTPGQRVAQRRVGLPAQDPLDEGVVAVTAGHPARGVKLILARQLHAGDLLEEAGERFVVRLARLLVALTFLVALTVVPAAQDAPAQKDDAAKTGKTPKKELPPDQWYKRAQQKRKEGYSFAK